MKYVIFFLISLYAHAAHFVVVVPSFNNSSCYKKNLDSIFSQTYKDYRLIYIDDASTDGTGTLVEGYLQDKGLQDRAILVRNEANRGALANIYSAVWSCAPEEIIVNLDGDDWFAHRDVLLQLAEAYSDREVWLTYGQFVYYPSYQIGIGQEIPASVIEQNEFRSYTRGTTALRTFYAGLFQQIREEDLLYQGGFFRVGYDLAIMLPMLEMAGRHIRYMPQVSYIYNFNSPINDHKVHFDEQAEVDRYLRSKEKYAPLFHYNKAGPPKKIYITPGLWGRLFDISNPYFNRDGCLEVLYKLRQQAAERGFELLQADSVEGLSDFEYLVVFDIFAEQLAELNKYPKEKLILFLWEPPSVLPENFKLENHRIFSKVFTWNDALVDNQKYFKFDYPVMRPRIEGLVPFYLKRLCTLIACNKSSTFPGELYTERRRLIQFYEDLCREEFDLFGKGWPASLNCYQGPIEKKADVLKFYKFNFAYENIQGIPGYITEKIFDCFQAGAVPVYWGAPNISDRIPKECFIAREDFPDDAALLRYLKEIGPIEYANYQQKIAEFLASPEAHRFSQDHFIEQFLQLITDMNDEHLSDG